MNLMKNIGKFESWRTTHMSDKNFMMILSVVVGLFVGIAAVIIKYCVHYIQQVATFFTESYSYFLYIAFPALGILLVILYIRYVNRNPVGHGIPSVLRAISKNNGRIDRHNMYSSAVSSALTIGFGGSAGLEGPSVVTGAAIGSNVGKVFNLSYKQIILLIGCASAGALASIFKAPITAMVFALEVIMLDLTMASVIPLLLSCSTALIISYCFMGQNVLYKLEVADPFILSNIPFYIMLGILTGFISLFFARTYKSITRKFEKIENTYIRWITGGILLGVLVFLLPSLYGEGYEVINRGLNADTLYIFERTIFTGYSENFWIMIALLFAIIILKVIATCITFGSGGVGGIFAPSLFLGVNTGLFFAKLVNHFGHDMSQTNFALVGMAGMISGIIYAPLTSIFMIAEITGGYSLILPLMLVAIISYATVRIFEKNSVYTFQLAERGELITHHKDKAVLKLMKMEGLIEKDFIKVKADETLGDLVKVVARSKRNVFPVVDEKNNLVGVLTLNDIRKVMFHQELYDTIYVRNIMYFPEHYVTYEHTIEEIAEIIETSGRYNIPVLKDGKYMGFLSRAKVFSSYRQMLKEFSED